LAITLKNGHFIQCAEMRHFFVFIQVGFDSGFKISCPKWRL